MRSGQMRIGRMERQDGMRGWGGSARQLASRREDDLLCVRSEDKQNAVCLRLDGEYGAMCVRLDGEHDAV